ncbi:hypothetical protein G6R40_13890 [Chryseobacterium sp. POL2]|uniref:hypothetical protein n=1 Tax=Chryseobacterium sp. POL2 TaxID=2713414 RepID=UPI0013E1969A|nr:hypothetical protein [Chryseobacterium sp. POL2]QIG90668.1 hypothetical protein G6R40_13890 [Chryseobacterium sp. POL2]
MNTTLLIILSLLIIVALFYYIRKPNRKGVESKNFKEHKSPELDHVKFNEIVNDFGHLLNGIPKSLINSPELNKIILKSISHDEIKSEIRKMHARGEFDETIRHYIVSNLDDIESIAYRILEISKETSNLPNYKFNQIELKEPYIISDLQQQLSNKLESTITFDNVSGKEIQIFILYLIQESKKGLMKFLLQS